MRAGIRFSALTAVIAALAISGAASGEAEAPANPILEAAKQNLLTLERGAGGTFSGPGFERLMADASAAQFFLIGEQHGVADIADLAAALHRAAVSKGYAYTAAEFGPWSARYAERLFRENDDPIAAIEAAPGGGLAIPFLFFAEDARMHAQAVRLSPAGQDALWGLDQEFVASGPVLASLLEGLARTRAQRAAVAAFAESVAQDPMLIGNAQPETFTALRAPFGGARDAEALELIDAMALSNEIYGPFTRGTGPIYPANLARETYMKRNFVARFEDAERRDGRPPKVVFKFGANHMMRGRSLTNVPALGNFVSQWGLARDFAMVNVLIDCAGGEMANIRAPEPVPCTSFILQDGGLLKPLAREGAITMIDLRPLRALVRPGSAIDPISRELIFAYDYYIALPDVRAARVLARPDLSGQ